MRTRRNLTLALLATLVLAATPAAGTAPTSEGGPQGPPWRATPAGYVSGPVEHVATVPLDAAGGVDAVLHDDLLVVTSWRGFSLYDVSDPEDPTLLSTRALAPALLNERPQTDGRLLLLSRDAQALPPAEEGAPRSGAALDVWDISDPTDPELVSTYHSEVLGPFRVQRDHMWTCVVDCTTVWSATGTIVDLSDPAAPRRLERRWNEVAPWKAFHYVGESAPGIVLVGADPSYVLDGRDDPTAPEVLVTFDPRTAPTGRLLGALPNPITNPTSLPARAEWPDPLRGRLAVVTMETPFTGPCSEASGEVRTWLTPGWRDTGTFEPADTYRITANGTYDDGSPPANAVGCGAYGLAVRPGFDQTGGQVGVTFFEHGFRFLDVGQKGQITELGGFVPFAGNSTATLWPTRDLVYVVDLHRGLEILRVTPGA
ncbi:MAG: LVIVD repeat-containing protein [Actinomycetes bacterium]